MGVKNFLKPTWKKLIIFAFMFVFTSIIGLIHEIIAIEKSPFYFIGSPLPYYFECNKARVVCPEIEAIFNIVALISDIILWYIVACAICMLLE